MLRKDGAGRTRENTMNKVEKEKGAGPMKRIKEMISRMYREDLEIQHKLLNLMLSAIFVGGLVSLVITVFLHQGAEVILSVVLMITIIATSLWLANKKNGKPRLAAFLVVFAANMFLFPFMYFTSGGLASGMPVWFVLGLTFSWLLLKGKIGTIMYVFNLVVAVVCMLLELQYPEMVSAMDKKTAICADVIQSVVVVTCIFGCIFKYQTYVYEKQKKALEKANKAKSEFLANMSHEIRTPINVVLGYNEMILRESKESQTATNALKVQAAGQTLLSLVNDILDFTAIEQGKLKLKKDSYDIQKVLQDVFVYAQYCAGEKGLKLGLTVEPAIPRVLAGDAVRLMQIMENLISNAVKYTKEGSIEVCIKWKEKEDKEGVLCFSVKDTGIGMKPEDVERISESFIRFDKNRTRNIQGIGLGLTIITRLLYAMGSKLSVESEIGKGSTFSFEVVQNVVDTEPIGEIVWTDLKAPTRKEEEQFEASQARILVVDDNEMNLDLFKGMLWKTKLQIDTAMNGEEAIACVKEKVYHLIFMDHMMPVMDGMTAMQKMRAGKLCEDTPIIVLTANAVSGAKKEYLDAGFDDYLSKPVLSDKLMLLLKKHLPQELYVNRLVRETENREAVAKDDGKENPLAAYLDFKTGMEYCCNSEEFYREMLGSYLSNDKHASIWSFYKQEDWEQYRILVHALKSTSLSIGAVKLSEAAKQLEMAAKDNRIDDIHANHESVMKDYAQLLSLIRKELNGEDAKTHITTVEADEKERILVVDDDTMNLKMAERLLESHFFVDCVTSGTEALEYFERVKPNLVLLDLHMPEMDGFAVMQEMKKRSLLRDIPVIFLTADNDSESEIRGFREGALDFIKKPFIADIMLQRIHRILELDRLQKNLQREVEKQTRKAEQRREKVERLSMQIMLTLAETIDAKDTYTNGHSVRVAQYAKEIARRIGKSAQEQEDIYYIGLLHDIGKIGIPNTIINKTSGLTDEEYALMKDHARIGADILGTMTEIPGLSIGAHWHHELYNGTGYPDGLKGDEIPEIARIIGVSDAYDAMTSKRSYRDVMPQEVVKEELRKGKGTQFDPKFADVMLQMMEEDKEYRMCAH